MKELKSLTKEIKTVHFIGIGGVSMSGLAQILMEMGYNISGSDIEVSKFTEKLTGLGARVYQPHDSNLMGKPDLVVYTAAVHPDNCEYRRAEEIGIPILNRADLLGEIMRAHKYGIGISGAHGKTSTTTMVSYLFERCGFDPTIHIGGEADFINGTVKTGNGNYFITEACEYTDTFLKLNPYIGIILNIDYDHVDWFSDLEDMQQSFLEFAQLIPNDGYLILCHDDENSRFLEKSVDCNIVRYGLNDKSLEFTAIDLEFDSEGKASFDLYSYGEKLSRVKLNIPGTHNVLNVLSAVASCIICGGKADDIKAALVDMIGPRRRFELKSDVNDIKVFADYAHNPAEINGTLEIASNMKHREIWAVFEPHTYTRVLVLFDDFVNSFGYADHVIMADIYNDREETGTEVSSQLVAKKVAEKGKDSIFLPDYESIANHLYKNMKSGDIAVILGSKFIEKVADLLSDMYSN
ncbi:MAG: UDP-N-acetylmuramate--L-alanine ligase [Clostridiales bacterium]|nr:UDP-N-acetylmuramate--L-alanine ligase [Clostridiales bacterium]